MLLQNLVNKYRSDTRMHQIDDVDDNDDDYDKKDGSDDSKDKLQSGVKVAI